MSDMNIQTRLDQLIGLLKSQKEVKGTELCSAIQVSRRTLNRYLEILEDMGYLLIYHKTRKTYSLDTNG
jgi:DeoR/GlpR family transcriptional regulator of sugar metabolism